MPATSTATQRLMLGHDTLDREVPTNEGRRSTRNGAAHLNELAVGFGDGVRFGDAVGVVAVAVGVALG